MALIREFVRQPNCHYLSVSKSPDTNNGITEFSCSFHNWSKETFTLDSNGAITEKVNVFEDCFNCPDFILPVPEEPEEPEEPEYTPEEYFEFDDETKTLIRFYPTGINNDLDPIYDVVVPPQIRGINVEEVGYYVEEFDSYFPVFASVDFEDVGVTSVILPDTVVSINNVAFSNCTSLVSVTLNNGLEYLGLAVFDSCTSLTSIIIPDSVIEMGEECFYDCGSLATISIGTGLTTIPSYAFYNSVITEIDLVNVTGLVVSAMAGCTLLEDVIMPKVELFTSEIFYLCESLNSFTFGDNVMYNPGLPGPPTIWRTVIDNVYSQYKSAGYVAGTYTYMP